MKRTVKITDKNGFVASLFDITKVELTASGATWFFYNGDDFVASLTTAVGLHHDFPEVVILDSLGRPVGSAANALTEVE